MTATRLTTILREARLDACMSLGQVEMETGIRKNQLCRLERHGDSGKITFETVARLAKVYRVSLDEIAATALKSTNEHDK